MGKRSSQFFVMIALAICMFSSNNLPAQSVVEQELTVAQWQELDRWITFQAQVQTLQGEFLQTRKLRALRVPAKIEGQVWFESDGDSRFRWQLGEPPRMVAIRTAEETLMIDVRKNAAQRIPASVDPAEVGGPAQGFLMMRMPVAESLEEFRALFLVTSMTEKEGQVFLDLTPRAAEARGFVKTVAIRFLKDSLIVGSFQINLADGGEMTTDFLNVKINHPIPDGTFSYDLTGLTIEETPGSPVTP